MEIQDEVKEVLEENIQPQEVEEVQTEEVEEQKPKKPTFEDRKKEIAKKTWEMREAERNAKEAFEKAKEQAKALEERERQLRERFPDEFEKEQKVDSKQRSEEEIVKEYLEKQKRQETVNNWGMAREEAIMDDPDFEKKEHTIAEILKINNNVDLVNAILESEKPIDLVNYLSSNLDEFKKIAKLSLYSAAKEIGKIETKLGEHKKPKTTSAPPPINKVKSNGTPAKSITEMSWEDFCREQNRKEYGR